MREIEQNIDLIKSEEEKFRKVIEAADRASLQPWTVQEKLEIVEFVKESREEIDRLRQKLNYNS